MNRSRYLLPVLAALLLLVPAGVSAQIPTDVSGSMGETFVQFAGVLAGINTFMHIIILMVLKMLGYLLQADFFNDPEMMGALNTIWQLSRNIMNVFFALGLVGVAFYSIWNANTDLMKSKIAHFIMAVIFVNFSWFFPRVIIDVANVLTATVYSIPNTLPSFTCQQIAVGGVKKDCEVVLDAAFLIDEAEQGVFCDKYGFGAGSPNCPCISGLGCYAKDTWKNAVTNNRMRPAHAMINGLAVSFAKVTNYAQVPNALSDGGTISPERVTLQIIMGVIMAFLVQIALVLPLIGLGVGLFIRIIIMWVCVAFMPFTFIGLLVNGKLGTNVFGFEVDVWKEFLTAAFLPVIVGVPFAIGFIMLGTVAKIDPPGGLDTFFIPLIPDVDNWWPMLWIFVSIAIIWTGSFTALRKSQIVGKVTDKLQGIGQQAFSGAARLPLLAPIPLPGTQNMTLGDVMSGPRKFNDALRQATREGYSTKEFGGLLAGSFNPQAAGGEKLNDGKALAAALKANVSLETKMNEKLGEIKNSVARNATPETRLQQVQNLKVELNMNHLTDQKFAEEVLSLKDSSDTSTAIKNLVSELKPELERIRNLST
ncbi:MAG: hypothetical protein ABL890_02380 [Candidatus Peribacteraceae bacterium]